jgi:putative membrane protein (TIGR04086 family)
MRIKWIQIGRSVLVTYVLSFILLLLFTVLVYQLQLNDTFIRGGVYVIYLIAGIAGGFLTGKQIRHRRLVWGILTAGLYCVIWLLPALFQGQTATDIFSIFPILAGLCIGGGILGSILS